MRVIFLDFDGVVIPVRNRTDEEIPAVREAWFKAPLATTLNRFNVAWLNRIVEATDAVVVVSSAWRLRRDLTQLEELLYEAGFVGEVYGKTPDHSSATVRWPPRSQEIMAWLDKWGRVYGIENFVVIDDMIDAEIDGHFVLCDPEKGLNKETSDEAIAILSRRR